MGSFLQAKYAFLPFFLHTSSLLACPDSSSHYVASQAVCVCVLTHALTTYRLPRCVCVCPQQCLCILLALQSDIGDFSAARSLSPSVVSYFFFFFVNALCHPLAWVCVLIYYRFHLLQFAYGGFFSPPYRSMQVYLMKWLGSAEGG